MLTVPEASAQHLIRGGVSHEGTFEISSTDRPPPALAPAPVELEHRTTTKVSPVTVRCMVHGSKNGVNIGLRLLGCLRGVQVVPTMSVVGTHSFSH